MEVHGVSCQHNHIQPYPIIFARGGGPIYFHYRGSLILKTTKKNPEKSSTEVSKTNIFPRHSWLEEDSTRPNLGVTPQKRGVAGIA